MSSNLLKNHSFESTSLEWQVSGAFSIETPSDAFEGNKIIEPEISNPGDVRVLSQVVRVPDGATHLHLVYAIRPEPGAEGFNGRFTARIQWLGSASAGLPELREDILETIEPGALVESAWQTRIPVSPAKPSGAVWARLRFVYGGVTGFTGDVQVDNVFSDGRSAVVITGCNFMS